MDNLHLDRWQRAANPSQYRRALDDKIEFYRHCRANGLATPPVLGVVSAVAARGTTDCPLIRDRSDLERLLTASEHGLFFKPIGGRHGLGVFSAIRSGDDVRCLGGVSSSTDFHRFCVERARESGPLVVQPRIRSARALLETMPAHGLATVRAVTFMDGASARLFAACLRIPIGGSEADNFRHGASGNLLAGIDAATGRLVSAVGSLRRDWPQIVDVARHPETGVSFAGYQLPCWHDLIQLVLDAQRRFTGLRSIGWDVAISDDGPTLIEGNGRYDCDIIQVVQDRGLRWQLHEILAAPGLSRSRTTAAAEAVGAGDSQNA
jgi:hypothetical protein